MPSIRPEQSRREEQEVRLKLNLGLGDPGYSNSRGGRVRMHPEGRFQPDSAAAGILEATPGGASESAAPAMAPVPEMSFWPAPNIRSSPLDLYTCFFSDLWIHERLQRIGAMAQKSLQLIQSINPKFERQN
ncbi:hypothetical protein Cadr_000015520 [Camelus dromedarius]|uniref:Uncharacterized protein n=1 Tax=Camelus dromedarius TaxID=9838 RepID=A0A5N4E9Z3_CAMDR|nr:hypothetical protein Cadr_000015520 [Camelus dromedarius]